MNYESVQIIGKIAALAIIKLEKSKYKDETLAIYKATNKNIFLVKLKTL